MFAVGIARGAGRSICVGIALWLALPLAVRAQAPENPLRTAASLQGVPTARPTPANPATRPKEVATAAEPDDIWAQSPQQATLRRVVAAEPQSPEPESIVPPQFGQPELLPPGNAAYDYPPEAFGDEHVSALGWPQPFVHPWLAKPWFSHSDPDDPYRHVGLGQPLIGTSWRNRPHYWGTFVGGILMGDMIEGRVNQNDTNIFGVRLGWDFDHYWGLEGRWAYAEPELSDANGAPIGNHSRNYYGDVSLLCYPLGDARWRPYLLGGVGFQTYHFYDEFGARVDEAPLAFPVGGGLKYFCNPWFTLRFDVIDNIAMGNDRVSFMNNVSLMVGGEFRFGGRRTSYYPWHNNTQYW